MIYDIFMENTYNYKITTSCLYTGVYEYSNNITTNNNFNIIF